MLIVGGRPIQVLLPSGKKFPGCCQLQGFHLRQADPPLALSTGFLAIKLSRTGWLLKV